MYYYITVHELLPEDKFIKSINDQMVNYCQKTNEYIVYELVQFYSSFIDSLFWSEW